MKKTIAILWAFSLLVGLVACGTAPIPATSLPGESNPSESAQAESAPATSLPGAESDAAEETGGGAVLVAYFTRTGSTAELAEMIHTQVGGELVALETAEPYPDDYNGVLAQAKQERDEDVLPELATNVGGMDAYDTVFIGYPIWHGDVPMAILSFLEGYTWEGKTVIPFCTHGGGGAYESFESVAAAVPGAEVAEGFSAAGNTVGSAAGPLAAWLESMGFAGQEGVRQTVGDLHITVAGQTLTAEFADNTSAEALRTLLAEGPLTIAMHDYARMEKAGSLGTGLPTNDEQMTTQPGDLVLYQGDSFVLYYGENTWSLTRLGKIVGTSPEELREILGEGDVTVTLSLAE